MSTELNAAGGPAIRSAPAVGGERSFPLPVLLLGWALVVAVLALMPHPHPSPEQLTALREGLGLWTVIPFALILGAAALLPLVAPHAWEHNRNKAILVSVIALPAAVYLAATGTAGHYELFEKAREYVAFITLIGTLFVLSGGVFLRGSLSGTPALNTAVLGMGAVLASLVGTTGASMLLIRPLLRANQPRQDKAHIIVFFIFVVSNAGGLLTPLGDPPLFLGFLKGVPFQWTLVELWPVWLVVNGVLLAVFFVMDRYIFNREEARRPGSQLDEVKQHEPLRVDGARNLVLFGVVVFGIFASGQGIGTGGEPWPFGALEGLLVGCALLSALFTPKKVHEENAFHPGPLAEVAILFAGIFVTMIPALLILNRAAPSLGLDEPWQYFWATGVLSSVLDNAPTYLSFAATAAGTLGLATEGRFVGELLATDAGVALVRAISAGAVLMGAMTYVGNGPNFIVKAIAEAAGIRMPGFFRYTLWAMIFLLPVIALAAVLFI